MPEEDEYCGNGTIRFHRFPTPLDGLQVSSELGTTIGMPKALRKEAIDRALADLRIVVRVLEDDPGDFTRFYDAVASGDFGTARDIATHLGLDEERFIEQGGGIFWLVVAVVAIAIVCATAKKAR
jgi:hypothetical protein